MQKKNKVIYVPAQWVTLVRCAKVKKPYIVFEMSNQDFLDFKPLVENSGLNWKTSTNNENIKWNDVKVVTTSFETPFILNIYYSLNTNSNCITINILSKKNRGRHTAHFEPANAYKKNIPIDKLKHNDLMSLCNKGLIPTVYHAFYSSLTTQ